MADKCAVCAERNQNIMKGRFVVFPRVDTVVLQKDEKVLTAKRETVESLGTGDFLERRS